MFRILANVRQPKIIQFTRLSTTPVPLKKKHSAEKHKIKLEEGKVIFHIFLEFGKKKLSQRIQ